MTSARFCRFELRTTATARARDFYDAVLGQGSRDIVELPAAAAARGAPPHWLGYLDVSGVGGVEEVTRRLVARGAERLGPPGDGHRALLRDAGGVIVAMTDQSANPGTAVAWHQLHTMDAASAVSNHVELFGWALGDRLDLGELGTYQNFAYAPGEPSIGSIADIAGRPHLHPQWLFFFAVSSLATAVAAARERGGVVVAEITLPNGDRAAVCDDAEHAAFGLLERK